MSSQISPQYWGNNPYTHYHRPSIRKNYKNYNCIPRWYPRWPVRPNLIKSVSHNTLVTVLLRALTNAWRIHFIPRLYLPYLIGNNYLWWYLDKTAMIRQYWYFEVSSTKIFGTSVFKLIPMSLKLYLIINKVVRSDVKCLLFGVGLRGLIIYNLWP